MSTTAVIESPSVRPASPSPAEWRRLALVVAGLVCAVALMLLAFLAPITGSGAHDLPIAVAGTEQQTDALTDAVLENDPEAFDVTAHRRAQEVTDAIRHREAVGGVVVTKKNAVTVYTASGAGTPYAPVMKGLGGALSASGLKVTYTDLAPLNEDDPTGAGLGALGLPLAFGGMISAMLLSTLMRGRPGMRAIGSLVYCALAGLVVSGLLQAFGTIQDHYWEVAGALFLGIAGISLVLLGLESVFGAPGIAVGAILMMFVANPLSGMSSGPEWLPAPWGSFGQFLPVGAAGTVVRSAAYFDGNGASRAVWVLVGWVLVGLALLGLAISRAKAAGGRATRSAGVGSGARVDVGRPGPVTAPAPGDDPEGRRATVTARPVARSTAPATTAFPAATGSAPSPALSPSGATPEETSSAAYRSAPSEAASATVTGTVTRGRTRPVISAGVTLVREDGTDAVHATTGRDGQYLLGPAASGRHVLVVSGAGLPPAAEHLTLTGGTTRHDVDLPGSAVLTGHVLRADGTPQPEALLTLTGEEGGLVASSRADGGGAFVVAGLTEGDYVLTASAPSATPVAQAVSLGTSDAVVVDVVLGATHQRPVV